MGKTISPNQTGLIFSIFAISLKMSALPAIMFSYSGNDCYITCFIALIFDFLGTISILTVMRKNPDMSFKDIITSTFGKVIGKVCYTILLLYFLAKCVLVLQELHDYFIATLFEELNPIYFLIVLGLLIMYATTKNFRTIGRVAELIFWPTFIGITFTLIFPIEDIQIEKLLPVFEQGENPIFMGLSRTTFAFGDYMILIPLMGKVNLNKKSMKTVLVYALGVFSFILSFYIIFVGSFGKFSMNQTLALGELPLHNTTPATIGKLEWLTIIIWTVILLSSAIILAIAGRHCIDTLFDVTDKKWTSYVYTLLVMLIVTITYMQLETIVELAISPVFATIAGAVQTLFVLISLASSIILRHKTRSRPSKPSHTPFKEKRRC